MHAYWRGTDQRSGALKEHGLDYRAQGGYVVAVPSLVDGRRYQVVQGPAIGGHSRLESDPRPPGAAARAPGMAAA